MALGQNIDQTASNSQNCEETNCGVSIANILDNIDSVITESYCITQSRIVVYNHRDYLWFYLITMIEAQGLVSNKIVDHSVVAGA